MKVDKRVTRSQKNTAVDTQVKREFTLRSRTIKYSENNGKNGKYLELLSVDIFKR